jgi:hypothetical protein
LGGGTDSLAGPAEEGTAKPAANSLKRVAICILTVKPASNNQRIIEKSPISWKEM